MKQKQLQSPIQNLFKHKKMEYNNNIEQKKTLIFAYLFQSLKYI